MAKATGSTHSAASAMRQSNTKRLMEIQHGNKVGKALLQIGAVGHDGAGEIGQILFSKEGQRNLPQPFGQRNPSHTAFRIGGKVGGVVLKVSGKQDQANAHHAAHDVKSDFFAGNTASHQIAYQKIQ